jgi:uncharacterized protein (DUF1499 family)
MAGCSGTRPTGIGVKQGNLAACPHTPNCVNSQTTNDKEHFIEPIKYEGDAAAAKVKLKEIIGSLPRTKIITDTEDYVYAEFTSLIWRFVDDVEFYFDDAKKVIHVRSASRLGKGDLGVNRKRIENIRKLFSEKKS